MKEVKQLGDVSELLKNKNFFHRVNGRGDNWFIDLENGKYAVIPITNICPIQLVDSDTLEKEINEFDVELNTERLKVLSEIDKRINKISLIKEEISIKNKNVKEI